MPLIDGVAVPLRLWSEPRAADVPEDFIEFLYALGKPTIIHQRGQDSSRCRAVVTLLHGNEPSGAMAVHQYLRSGEKPLFDMHYLIISVNTALAEPRLSHRFLPALRDMNRCFNGPFETPQGNIARAILDYLRSINAEAVIDIHNTSGEGPAFSVCTHNPERCYDIASLFTHRLIYNNMHLGSLMEANDLGCPVVTIECGGSQQIRSHEVAFEGLQRYCREATIFHQANHDEIDLYYHPVRLELTEGATLTYADQAVVDVDLTLPTHIDRRNFGVVLPDTPLAWVNGRGMGALMVRDEQGGNVADQYFRVCDGKLYAAKPLKLFMVTTNPMIARTDCILYAVSEADHRVLFTR